MGFETKKEKLSTQLMTKQASEYNLEIQLNLPDYCNDIKRILKCNITPCISNVSTGSGKITVKGSVAIRVVYINEKDKADCCEANESFSHSFNADDAADNCVFGVIPSVNYINCRAVSQRRITVNSNIAFNYSCYTQKSKDILVDVNGETLQCKTSSVIADNIICSARKIFEMSETVSLPQEKSSIGKIMHVNCYAVIDSKKAVTGKLLIKGEMYCKMVYCTREGQIQSHNHTMPISQIIDVAGLSEDCDVNVRLDVISCAVAVRSDSSAENRLIEIAVKAAALVRGSKRQNYIVTDECYCTDYDVKTEFEANTFTRLVHSADRQITVKKAVEMPSGVKGILCAWPCENTCTIKGEGNKAQAAGNATLGILYTDENDATDYCEKSIDYDFEEVLNEAYGNLTCGCDTVIRSVQCTAERKDSISVTLEIGVKADIYCNEEKRMLSGVEILKDSPKKVSDAALIIYFADEAESIWDIAKKYNTTVDAIRQENEIEGEKTKAGTMLVIPCLSF